MADFGADVELEDFRAEAGSFTNVAMDLTTFLIQCLNAVQYGLLLFLLASGLTLIFGIMGVINLAHGSFYMLGAYLAFSLAPLFGSQFLLMLACGAVLSFLFGYLLEWAFFSYLYQRDHLQQVLMTYALILVFEELRSLLDGNDVHGVPPTAWRARQTAPRPRTARPSAGEGERVDPGGPPGAS